MSRPGTPFGTGGSHPLPTLLPTLDADEDEEGAALAAMTARGAQSLSKLSLKVNWRPSTADASRDQLQQMLHKEREDRRRAEEALKGLSSQVQRLNLEVEERAEDLQELEEEHEILASALRERTESEKKAERDARLQAVVFKARAEKQKQACDELARRFAEAKREVLTCPVENEAHRPVSREEALDTFRMRLLSLLNAGGSTSWTKRPATADCTGSSRTQLLGATTSSMKDSPPSLPGSPHHVSSGAQLLKTTSSMQDSPPSELNSSAERALAAMQDVVIDDFSAPTSEPPKDAAQISKADLHIAVDQTARSELKVMSSNQSTCTPSSEMASAEESSPTPASSCEQLESPCQVGHQRQPAESCQGSSSRGEEIAQEEDMAHAECKSLGSFSKYYRAHFAESVADGVACRLFDQQQPPTQASTPFSEYYCKHFVGRVAEDLAKSLFQKSGPVDEVASEAYHAEEQEVTAPFSAYYCKHFAGTFAEDMARSLFPTSTAADEAPCKVSHAAVEASVDRHALIAEGLREAAAACYRSNPAASAGLLEAASSVAGEPVPSKASLPFSHYYGKHFLTAPVIESMARAPFVKETTPVPFSHYYGKHFRTAPVIESMAQAPFGKESDALRVRARKALVTAANDGQLQSCLALVFAEQAAQSVEEEPAVTECRSSKPTPRTPKALELDSKVLEEAEQEQALERALELRRAEEWLAEETRKARSEATSGETSARSERIVMSPKRAAEAKEKWLASSLGSESVEAVEEEPETLQTPANDVEVAEVDDSMAKLLELEKQKQLMLHNQAEELKEALQDDAEESEDDDEEDEESEESEEEEEEEQAEQKPEEQDQNKMLDEDSLPKVEQQSLLEEQPAQAELEKVVALDESESEEESSSEDESGSDDSSESGDESVESGAATSARAENESRPATAEKAAELSGHVTSAPAEDESRPATAEKPAELSETAIWRGSILKIGSPDPDAKAASAKEITTPKVTAHQKEPEQSPQVAAKAEPPSLKPPIPQDKAVSDKVVSAKSGEQHFNQGFSGRSSGSRGSARSSLSVGSSLLQRAASEGRTQWGADARTGVSHVHPVAPLKLQSHDATLSAQQRGSSKKNMNMSILTYEQAQAEAVKRRPPSLPSLGLRQRSEGQLKASTHASGPPGYEKVHLARDIVHVVELERKPYMRRGKKESERHFVSRKQHSRLGVMHGLYGPLCQMKVPEREAWADNDRDYRDKGSMPRVQSLPLISATRSPPGARMEARSIAYSSPQRLSAMR